MELENIDTKFSRGDIVQLKESVDKQEQNIPWPSEFEIMSVMIPKQYPDGQIKYEKARGRAVCRKKIDRIYELKEE